MLEKNNLVYTCKWLLRIMLSIGSAKDLLKMKDFCVVSAKDVR
jgi:hypothetical protein